PHRLQPVSAGTESGEAGDCPPDIAAPAAGTCHRGAVARAQQTLEATPASQTRVFEERHARPLQTILAHCTSRSPAHLEVGPNREALCCIERMGAASPERSADEGPRLARPGYRPGQGRRVCGCARREPREPVDHREKW